MKKAITATVYGYARISTKKQSIDRQIRNIKEAYPDAVMVTEVYTGTTTQRPAFERLLKQLHKGDTVVFDSVSRMSRDADEGFSLYKRLFAEGMNLVFIKEPHINTDTFKAAMQKQLPTVSTGDNDTDKMMNTIMAAIMDYTMALAEKQIKLAFEQAQKEVDDLRQRTREGLQTAKLNGKQVGQVKGSNYHIKKADAAKAIILKHSADFNGTLNDTDVLKLAGVSRNTYYQYKRELKEGR